MKDRVKYILQKLLGFRNYLFIFSLFKIKTLNSDKKERDFLFFLKLIPPGGVVLDIGANIGIMTVYLAKKVKDTTVFAFEPLPYNLQALKRVIAFFKLNNVQVFGCALGNRNGEAEMVMPIMRLVRMQGLSHVVHQSITGNNEGERFKTEIKALDSMNELMNPRDKRQVTAIKIDVENFEFFVLEGARELLQKYKPVIYCELWDNENRLNCFALMTKLGYQIKIPIDKRLVAYTAEIAHAHPTQNFFFVHPESGQAQS